MLRRRIKAKIVEELARRKRKYVTAADEVFTYNSASTYYMLKTLKSLEVKNVLSVGGAVEHIIPMSAIYPHIKHVSMIECGDLEEFNKTFGTDIYALYTDFFNLEDDSMGDIDTVVSHVCIHCMVDSRYKNDFKEINQSDIPRPYMFAKKLKRVCPKARHIIVSVDIGDGEKIQDNGSWLDEKSFIKSFEDEGYKLKDKYYDVFRYNLIGEWDKRFYEDVPKEWVKNNKKAVGNFYFELED